MISLQRWMKEERREKKKRERYSVTVVTVVTVFWGGVYELGLLSNCYYYI